MPDGTVVQPTNKKFHIDFCIVAHWNERGEIVEENPFYDLMGMLKQIGAGQIARRYLERHARMQADDDGVRNYPRAARPHDVLQVRRTEGQGAI